MIVCSLSAVRCALALSCVCILLLMGCKKQSDEVAAPQITYVYIDPTQLPADAIVDVDGNIYRTVTIGEQRWMKENLRTSRYSNGDLVPYEPGQSEWVALGSGAWTTYGNDANQAMNYGMLYNGYTVLDPRNVCPSGWHVPTDEDWQELEVGLGMSGSEIGNTGTRGQSANVGGKLKAVELWNEPNLGASDSVMFTAYGGGHRTFSGVFTNQGATGTWWSSSVSGSTSAFVRTLISGNVGINRNASGLPSGYSIRCIED